MSLEYRAYITALFFCDGVAIPFPYRLPQTVVFIPRELPSDDTRQLKPNFLIVGIVPTLRMGRIKRSDDRLLPPRRSDSGTHYRNAFTT